MRKSKIFTFSIFLLSLIVVLGGWYLTRTLLERRREEFLGRTGEIIMQSSETALFSAGIPEEDSGADAGNIPFQRETLSEDMMAKVLAVWESSGRELPHEPKRGQMNMEQAIEAGKEWIAAMAEQNVIPKKMTEEEFDHIAARLCTPEAQVDFDENLLSYWTLTFVMDDVEVDITIHAMSGDIWKAGILKDEQKSPSGLYEPDSLLGVAFPFIEAGEEIMVFLDNNTTSEPLPQRLVYASVRQYSMLVSGKKPAVKIEFWLSNAFVDLEGVSLQRFEFISAGECEN